jgi:hypothetical protein
VGALYVRGVDGTWVTVFIAISLCTAAGFALFAAQTIQDVLDKKSDELRRPLMKFIELDWLDYRSEQISKETVVTWQEIPSFLRAALIAGATAFIVIGNVIIHASDAFFGNFSVTDNLNHFRLFGHSGLVKKPGVVALTVSLAAFLARVVCDLWLKRFTLAARSRAAAYLDQQEMKWKEARRQEIDDTEQMIGETPSGEDVRQRNGAQISVYGCNAEAAQTEGDNLQLTVYGVGL